MAKNRVKRIAVPIFYSSFFVKGRLAKKALDTREPHKCDLVECLHASNWKIWQQVYVLVGQCPLYCTARTARHFQISSFFCYRGNVPFSLKKNKIKKIYIRNASR
jgi:hypothetical protein